MWYQEAQFTEPLSNPNQEVMAELSVSILCPRSKHHIGDTEPMHRERSGVTKRLSISAQDQVHTAPTLLPYLVLQVTEKNKSWAKAPPSSHPSQESWG